MAGTIQNLMTLLSLDARSNRSNLSDNRRTIMIRKDYTNQTDFVFNNFLQHFSRKEPRTPLLLITLSHDWSNYSACAAKCGCNLRKSQNSGNIDVLNAMGAYMEATRTGDKEFNLCHYISANVGQFIEKHQPNARNTDKDHDDGNDANIGNDDDNDDKRQPINIMIDSLNILISLGCTPSQVILMVTGISNMLCDQQFRTGDQSKSKSKAQPTSLSHLIIQSMVPESSPQDAGCGEIGNVVSHLYNYCDIILTLMSLETGFSTKADGYITITDTRLPVENLSPHNLTLPHVGEDKTYHFKLSDRMVRLSPNVAV